MELALTAMRQTWEEAGFMGIKEGQEFGFKHVKSDTFSIQMEMIQVWSTGTVQTRDVYLAGVSLNILSKAVSLNHSELTPGCVESAVLEHSQEKSKDCASDFFINILM